MQKYKIYNCYKCLAGIDFGESFEIKIKDISSLSKIGIAINMSHNEA
jgi:hypothetical protein